MEGGRSPRGSAGGNVSFVLATVLVTAVGLAVFQAFAPPAAEPGVPVGATLDFLAERAVGHPFDPAPEPSSTKIEQPEAHTALSALMSGRPARYRIGPLVLAQATGMMVTSPISLLPGRYELWLGCVGDGLVRLSIIGGPTRAGVAQMHVVEWDCVDEDGMYAPEAVDPVDEFPAFHPPGSAGLWGREGASTVLEVPDDRFQAATVQLSGVAVEPLTVAWRMAPLDLPNPFVRIQPTPEGSGAP
jgi:hypothetical protein